MFKILTEQEVKDILVGCTILSTGGGGDLAKGLKLIEDDFKAGLEFRMLPLESVRDEDLFVAPYFCGSIGESAKEGNYYNYPEIDRMETEIAVETLERFFGENISGMISIEYGGLNTAVALSTAARLNKYIVDADAAGRAVPDLQFSTFYVNQVPIYPLAVANKIGDIAVFEKVVDDFRAEDLVRALAVVSGNFIGMADHPCRGKELKKSVIPGALSYAGKVGKAQRTAVEKGENPIEAILKSVDGFLLFEGIVKEDSKYEIKDGFTTGTIEIFGKDSYENSQYKIWYKNENVISWKDDEVSVTVPDLICVVDRKTGYPINNPYCKKGMEVAVLGFKAPEFWLTERGLSILNPKFFGFEVEHIPIEKKFSDVSI